MFYHRFQRSSYFSLLCSYFDPEWIWYGSQCAIFSHLSHLPSFRCLSTPDFQHYFHGISSFVFWEQQKQTVLMSTKKKKKNRSLDRDTGTVFGRNLSFFPNALHSVLLSCVSLNAIVKSGWVGLKLGVLSDFDHRGSSKCSQTRRHGCEMTRMND